jgi:hypothetical protein
VSSSAAPTSREVSASVRSPLEQLLHALNQPLTGLQCSMEVALATPRTVEYYAERLRQGLELTERMRALVKAIREVTDAAAAATETTEVEEPEAAKFHFMVGEVLRDLRPVAAAKELVLAQEGAAISVGRVRARSEKWPKLLFRMLESAVSLAAAGEMRVAVEEHPAGQIWIRVRWPVGPRLPEFYPAELGMLVAQAEWELMGAKWERLREQGVETVTLRLRKT